MGYFGFADGPTGNEGWQSIGPNTALAFEKAAAQPGNHASALQQEQAFTGGAK